MHIYVAAAGAWCIGTMAPLSALSMAGNFMVDTLENAGAHTWMILKGLEDFADVHTLRYFYHVHA